MERGLAITRSGFPGLITHDHSFSPEELARQPFQQEFARRHGVECEAGMVLATDVDTHFILTLNRSARIGSYEGEELRRMNLLMERIKVACHHALAFKIAGIADTIALMDSAGDARAFLSWTGRVIAFSRAFEVAYPRHFQYRQGRIQLTNASHDKKLQAALSAALRMDEPEARTEVFFQAEGNPLIVHVTPVVGSPLDLLGVVRAIVTVPRYHSTPSQITAVGLRTAFSLTDAEIRLALRIGRGETLSDVATNERISLESARTRLKTIFQKTGTHRQVDLVLLLDELQRR